MQPPNFFLYTCRKKKIKNLILYLVEKCITLFLSTNSTKYENQNKNQNLCEKENYMADLRIATCCDCIGHEGAPKGEPDGGIMP